MTIALITGANKGIGLETARQLAAKGIHVLIGARDAANGQAAAQTLQAAGYKADFIALDVSDEASVKQAAHTVTDRYGKLDILVNTAGYNSSKTALNGLTVQLAKQLTGTSIKVNSACPGWVQTDMGSAAAPRTVQEGARIIIKLATLPNDGPNGGFFDEAGEIGW